MSVHELLTMASLIEEEATAKADEKKFQVYFTIDLKKEYATANRSNCTIRT